MTLSQHVLSDADLGGRSVELDLIGERVLVEVRVFGGDGFGDQLVQLPSGTRVIAARFPGPQIPADRVD